MSIARVGWAMWGVMLICACTPPEVETSAERVAAAAPVVARPAAAAPACLVTKEGIGPLRLGMTVAEARRSFPEASFKREIGADGVAMIAVASGRESLMLVYAGEDDAGPIDPSRRIEYMETFNPRCGTADGVRVGARIEDVKEVLGDVELITQSEIESRESVRFARQPGWITFRLNYTGIFAEGATETTRAGPDAKIFSMAISTGPASE